MRPTLDAQPATDPPLWLELAGAAQHPRALVGGKAFHLSQLARSGAPVPPAVVLTTEAWRAAATTPSSLHTATPSETHPDLPNTTVTALHTALAHVPGPWAIRSSSPAEDAADHSAAGQFLSVLGVETAADAERALRACYASAASSAARAYFQQDAPASSTPPSPMAVLVQTSIVPQAAGVAFSRTRDGKALVEAVRGHGQQLVDGAADPTRYLCAPDTPPTHQGPDVLPAEALDQVLRWVQRAEEVLGVPADMEWAWDGAQVHVLQARPITREIDSAPPPQIRWTAANTQEALLDPVTPLTWSLFAPLVERGRRDVFRWAGLEEIPGPGYMRLYAGLPYFNPDYFRAFLRQIPGLPTHIFDTLIFGEDTERVPLQLPEANATTARLLALFLGARVGARERFEVYLRLTRLRLRWITRKPLERLDDAGLAARRRRLTDLLEGSLRRHVLGTAISGAAYVLLDLFLDAHAAEDTLGPGLVARLTAGAPGNALAEANAELERLAREVARTGDSLADGWVQRRLERFLTRHGHRTEKEAELSEPRWADDPRAIVEVLRSFVRAAGDDDQRGLLDLEEAEDHHRATARALAQRVEHALRTRAWERWVPARRLVFRALLREARRYAPYRENLKDQALRAIHEVRRVFLEQGRRLAQRSVLEASADVFFLEVDEVEAALRGGRGWAETVRERRAERERFAAEEAPRYVLEVPGQPPRPVYARAEAGALREGVGVSGGRVEGRARVLRSVDEAHRLQPGDILVARVINAGWTPLFHLAGGIVAEVGGALSHAAIVAREYGLPAVFAARGATSIPDGAWVCVDGDLGLVTLETRGA